MQIRRIAHLNNDVGGQVLIPLSRPAGIRAWFPATIITAIVSPIALPIPSMTPAMIPEDAAGSVIKKTALFMGCAQGPVRLHSSFREPPV